MEMFIKHKSHANVIQWYGTSFANPEKKKISKIPLRDLVFYTLMHVIFLIFITGTGIILFFIFQSYIQNVW